MPEKSMHLEAQIESCRRRLADGRDPATILLDLHGILSRTPADTSSHCAGLKLLASLCDQHGQHVFGHGSRLHALCLQNQVEDENIVVPQVWSLVRYSVMLLCHTMGLPLSNDFGKYHFEGYTLSISGATGASVVSMSWSTTVGIPAEKSGSLQHNDVVISIFDLSNESTKNSFRELSVGGPVRLSESVASTLLLAASVVMNLGFTVSVNSEDFENLFSSTGRMINGQFPLELCPGIPRGDDPLDWIGAATLQRLRGAMLFAIKLYGKACALLSALGDQRRQSETYFEIVESYIEMGYVREAELMYRHLQADICPAELSLVIAHRWGRLGSISGTNSGASVPVTSSAPPSVSATPDPSGEAPSVVNSDSLLIEPEIIQGAGYQFDPATGKVLGGALPEEAQVEFEAGQALNQAWDTAFPEDDSPFAVPLRVSIFEADIPELGNPRKLRRMKLTQVMTLQKEPPFTRLNYYDELPEAATRDDAAKRFARRIGSAIWIMHFRLRGSFSSEFGSSISPGNISVSGGVYDYETVQLPGHGRHIEEFQRQDLINAVGVIRYFVERSAGATVLAQMLRTFYEAYARRAEPSERFLELVASLECANDNFLDVPAAAECAECFRTDVGSAAYSDDDSEQAETDDVGDRSQQRLQALTEQALKEAEPAEHLIAIARQQSDPAKAMLQIASAMGAAAAKATNKMAADREELADKLGALDAARKVGDMERVIVLAKEALTLVTKEAEPVRWAALHSTLATHLIQHGSNDHAQDLEDAIGHLRLALEVRTRETLPVRWADTHINLGMAYYLRIRGDRSNNMETAIQNLKLALEIFTRDTYTPKWGEAQSNLGTLYYDRVAGDRTSNLEAAIDCYKLALQVLSRQRDPVAWANAHSNLANAYFRRIAGDRRENVANAIEHGRLALEVLRRETFPGAWAKTIRNLANFYRSKSEWGGDEDLLTAVNLSYQVLEILTREADSDAWATVRDELSIALKAIPFSAIATVLPWKDRLLL